MTRTGSSPDRRIPRPVGLAGLLALVLCLAVSACARTVDAEQARICRTLIPALNAPGGSVDVVRIVPTDQAGRIRVYYAVSESGRDRRNRFVECTFRGDALSRAKGELVAVMTERGRLGEAAFLFLDRFYLRSPEAALEDPGSIAADLPVASFATAYALQTLMNALPQAGVYALLAASYSLIYGLVGRIVFGFGELAALGGYGALLGVTLALQAGASHPLAALAVGVLLAALAATLHGIVAGRLVVAPLVASPLPVLIGTVGLMLLLAEYLRIVQGSDLRWMPPVYNTPLPLLRAGSFVATTTPAALVTAATGAAMAVFLLVVMRRSAFGRNWRAIADDPLAASLFGVDGRRVFAVTFALAAALAGVAGFVMTAYYGGVGYGAGLVLGLKALVAAVLGGIGSVGGALLGGLAIGLAEALWSATMPIESRDIAVFVLLSVVLALRPGGLRGFGDLLPRRV
ncbi:MAG: branched-chain amino acid ABC transporter permease [Burkholderiales bacterium]|nr:branched-chain amino acid ABC transporter permease [Burkholderiales bacterium]